MQIDYFGTAEGETEPDWYSEWIEEPRLPAAIRIRLSTEDLTWPDLLMRLPEF